MDCATWWIDHVTATYLYVTAVRTKDAREQENQVEKLVEGATSWGKLIGVPEATPLMMEHVGAVKALVDAAFAGDMGTVDQAVNVLMANVEQQTALYASKIANFPATEWKNLFTKHVASTGGYVLALAAGDAEAFRKDYGIVIADRNALARMWTIICMRRGLK